jgi:hypothetical protein
MPIHRDAIPSFALVGKSDFFLLLVTVLQVTKFYRPHQSQRRHNIHMLDSILKFSGKK